MQIIQPVSGGDKKMIKKYDYPQSVLNQIPYSKSEGFKYE